MATETEIISVLRDLAEIFGQEPPSVRGYVLALDDVPADALRRSVRTVAKTLRWFPKPAELLEAAEAQMRTGKPEPDLLQAEVLALEDGFYQDRSLDGERMEQIAVLYERSDRPYMAGWVREKLRRWRLIAERKASGFECSSEQPAAALAEAEVLA